MPKFESEVLVTDRRRTSRLRAAPERKPLSSPPEVIAPKVERSRAEPSLKSESRNAMKLLRCPSLSVGKFIDRRRQDRRRQIDPTTCERDYSDNEIEFMRAMDDYKRKSGRPFPTWKRSAGSLMSLGYRKVRIHRRLNGGHSRHHRISVSPIAIDSN